MAGQVLRVTADERKTLLAAGAVAGIAATWRGLGRVPLIAADGSRRVVGILSRSELLAAHERRLDAGRPAEPTLGRFRATA